VTAEEYLRLPQDSSATGFTRDGQPVTLEQVAAQLPACLLCGRVPVLIGCFIPSPTGQRAFLDVTEPLFGPVRPGKERIVFYALCHTCADDPTTPGAVEARLLGEAGS
jgi:hypothetical protein